VVRQLDRIETPIEAREITRRSLEAYISGCEELAVRLDTIIEKVGEGGKRPVILIPSRGAVPIFLEAKRFLDELHGEASPLNGKNARYYPKGIFDFLEQKGTDQPDNLTTVDVILFPFTADVSLENTDDEKLAKELRVSCARSVLHLVKRMNGGRQDFEWYKFLMKKLKAHNGDPSHLNPNQIVESLESFLPNPDSQIILIDTVISGRAAHDITGAFYNLGDPIVPLLAVDTVKGSKFDQRRKAEIQDTFKRDLWKFLPDGNPYNLFVEFPLITEDKGAALLGVMALNFIDFNEDKFFNKVNATFLPDFKPQSCIWTLPPPSSRRLFLSNFREFMDAAWNCKQESLESIKDDFIRRLAEQSRTLTSSHPVPTHREISEILKLSKDAVLKESGSHIVSVSLPRSVAKTWVQEFASHLSANSYSTK